jgi:hypothetical protein
LKLAAEHLAREMGLIETADKVRHNEYRDVHLRQILSQGLDLNHYNADTEDFFKDDEDDWLDFDTIRREA